MFSIHYDNNMKLSPELQREDSLGVSAFTLLPPATDEQNIDKWSFV